MTVTPELLLQDPITSYPQATVAAFDPTTGDLPRRQLDEAKTIAFYEKLASVGAAGLLIASSTGHGHLRTVDELRQWIQCAAKADLKSTTAMALLRPEDGMDANQTLLDDVASLNIPIVFFRPGTNLPDTATPAESAAHLQPFVAAAAERGLAVGLYSIPDVSGLPLVPETVAELLEQPGGDHIVAIKVTEADYDQSTRQFLEHPALSRLKVVQGWDPHLAAALRDGPKFDQAGRQRCGVTSGPMSFAVHQYLHILQHADQQNWEEVAVAQDAVTALFQSMQDDPRKFADLQRAKYMMGLGEPLTAEIAPEQIERVSQALAALPRDEDRQRLARSLDLMEDGPCHDWLAEMASA